MVLVYTQRSPSGYQFAWKPRACHWFHISKSSPWKSVGVNEASLGWGGSPAGFGVLCAAGRDACLFAAWHAEKVLQRYVGSSLILNRWKKYPGTLNGHSVSLWKIGLLQFCLKLNPKWHLLLCIVTATGAVGRRFWFCFLWHLRVSLHIHLVCYIHLFPGWSRDISDSSLSAGCRLFVCV